jgi:hypothetical protein
MTLPPDIESYREEKRFFNPKVPDAIAKRWLERIDKYDLQYKGEKGAQMYLDKYGRNISEEKAVHFAILAENLGYPEMAEGFWKKAFSLQSEESTPKIKKTKKSAGAKKMDERVRAVGDHLASDIDIGNRGIATMKGEDKRSLREWWHEVLRTHRTYSCYGIFLTLPSDVEALRYLTEYGKELNQISSKSCLIIALGKTEFQRTGFDEGAWQKLVNEQSSEGYSITVARLFGIGYGEFPCLLLFQDIRSPDHKAFKLQGMTAEQIALRMRLIFTTVDNAMKTGNNPLDELQRQQNIELLQQKGQLVASKISGWVEKTFEKGMEAWFNSIKSP